MLIVGLISNMEEAKEIEYVARIFTIACRIKELTKQK
jgi:hypothetical protein